MSECIQGSASYIVESSPGARLLITSDHHLHSPRIRGAHVIPTVSAADSPESCERPSKLSQPRSTPSISSAFTLQSKLPHAVVPRVQQACSTLRPDDFLSCTTHPLVLLQPQKSCSLSESALVIPLGIRSSSVALAKVSSPPWRACINPRSTSISHPSASLSLLPRGLAQLAPFSRCPPVDPALADRALPNGQQSHERIAGSGVAVHVSSTS
jgi:hypothetical protein